MKILSKLSIRNLKLNKKRTISTIIGIILSVALICAAASLAISFQATLIENAINETGYWHIQLIDVKDNQIKDIQSNRDIKKIHEVRNVGYSELNGSKNKDKPYVKLFSMNKETFDTLKFELTEGNFPSSNREIVISKSIIKDAKIDLKIGDIVNFDIGERKTIDNYDLDKGNPYNSEEEQIINKTNYSFKIVGFIERPDRSFEQTYDPGYTIISTGILDGKSNLYVSLNNPKNYKADIPELLGIKSYNDLNVIKSSEPSKYEDYAVNRELLRWEAFAFSDSTVTMLFAFICIIIVVIVITSVFCIRNSFAIATTEKIKMYSMLASVGTTKKQIKKNVIVEGLTLGCIGIPIGILSGFFAVYVLLKIVNLIIGDYLLAHVDGLVFKISLIPIVISIILGFLTIYLSARSSAKKASKVSPIEGLRNSNEIKIQSKKLKTPKIVQKLFKTGGVLAYKNLKRSKKKYRTTVISIAISIFIFITMNAFITNMFDITGDYYIDYSYNLQLNVRNLPNEDINKIISKDGIKEYSILYNTAKSSYHIKDMSKINLNDIEEAELADEGYYDEKQEIFIKTGGKYLTLELVALDNAAFKRFSKDIGIKYEDVKDKGILCDEYGYTSNGRDVMSRTYKYNKGDKIVGEFDSKKLEIELGAVSKKRPYGIERSYYRGGYLVLNIDEFENLGFTPRTISIDSENASELEKDIKEINDRINIFNIEDSAKEQRAMVLVTKIFLYGFITVITLIGVTNIFNTITSNMELRQKEFANLKSIGMTKKEFNRMINLETCLYGSKAWIYGTVMGLLGTFAMYQAASIKKVSEMYIPINAILLSAIFVFVFVFIIMRYSIKKINKQNIIETIRKDNI